MHSVIDTIKDPEVRYISQEKTNTDQFTPDCSNLYDIGHDPITSLKVNSFDNIK